jgi:SPP1 gp7 family putative phage head morphogenesis protein
VQQIRAALEPAGSLTDVLVALANVRLDPEPLAKDLASRMMLADGLGVGAVRAEVEEALEITRGLTATFADEDGEAGRKAVQAEMQGWWALGLPYAEQLEVFRAHTFKIAEEVSAEVLEQVKAEVDRAIESGATVEEFRRAVDALFEAAGYAKLSPWRIETIYRNNLASSYQAARYRQMTDPDVVAALPYWQYSAVMDMKTRPAHAFMNGKVFRVDDPIWKVWFPPAGWNCRCGVRAMSAEMVEAWGLTLSNAGELPEYIEAVNPKTGQPIINRKTGEVKMIRIYPDKGWDKLPLAA